MLLFAATPVVAAPISFYPGLSGQSSGDTGEGRWTYFEVLQDVKLTNLGINLNPSSSSDRFMWEVHSVTTAGAILQPVFQLTTSYSDDDALTVKDIKVNIDLSLGNYVLGLTTLDAPWQIMVGPNTVSGGYFGPGFVTSDSNFRLWDAGSSTPRDPLQPGNNGVLAAFSIGTEGGAGGSTPVPEPNALVLTLLALVGVFATRRSYGQRGGESHLKLLTMSQASWAR